MSKKHMIGLVLAIFLGAGAYLLFSDTSSQPSEPAAATVRPGPAASDKITPPSSTELGQYVNYREGIIAATPGEKILFFHAPWCPQCRALETDIKANAIPNGTTIIKVDYDSMQVLRQQYGVTLQTTVVRVDDNGNKLALYNAYDDPTLAAVLENLY